MRFTPSFLDEIRARLPVSQVVARRVKLKRQGREMIGLSPFKSEKTPSFTVNDQKGFYHCFASGEHGDIFRFVMTTEGLGFPEAVERLAGEAGVPIPVLSQEASRQEDERERLRQAMDEATRFFEAQLNGAKGAEARAYLDRRGVGDAQREAFRLGFAPAERHALKQHLAAKGYTQAEMTAAGLIIAGDDIPVSYDRFRHRLIFPITDHGNRVVAFGGRALASDATPKYLNSPETPLFRKGELLFNAARARSAAHASGQIIVVEGYMDVIALAGAGIGQAVAPLGTALTERQLQLLWRFVPEPVLCFDGDEAGLRAASRAVDLALPQLKPGLSLAFVFLPAGCDPDDVVRQRGAGAMAEMLRTPSALVEVLWQREAGGAPIDTPERRASLESRIEALLGGIGDPRVRDHYARELRNRMNQLWQSLSLSRYSPRDLARDRGERGRRASGRFLLGGAKQEVSASLKRSALVRFEPSRFSAREALIVATLLNHPWLAEQAPEEVASLVFAAPALARLRDEILRLTVAESPLDSATLRTHLALKGLGATVKSTEAALSHRSDAFALEAASPEDVERGWRHVLALHRAGAEFQQELDAAERALHAEASPEAYERLRVLRLQTLEAPAEGEAAAVQPVRVEVKSGNEPSDW